MPRSLAAPLLVLLVAAAPLSAQNDTTPSISGDTTTILRPGTGLGEASGLHAGQWAARFSLGNNFIGIGALLFTSPRAAWALAADVRADYADYGDVSQEREMVGITIGRRWYGEGRSRVRPLGGAGFRGNYTRNYTDYTGIEQETKTFNAGIYGEVGAAIFFTPELSLGATWGANVYKGFTDEDDQSQYGLSAGYLSVEGVFYF